MAQSKAALGRLATQLRTEMGLSDDDPFDPFAWSVEWGVPFLSLSDLAASDEAVRRFTLDRPELWSAALIQDGRGHIVVYNAAHSPARLRSNLAHEVAHVVVEHSITLGWMTDDGGCAGSSRADEREAAEFAGSLLIPTERAKVHAIKGRDPASLAAVYRVSVEMAQWRMRLSGGERIANRSRAKWQTTHGH